MTLAVVIHLCIAGLPLPGRAAADQPAKERVDLLVYGGTAVTMDPAGRIIADAAIAVRGDTIIAVGPRSEVVSHYAPGGRVPDSEIAGRGGAPSSSHGAITAKSGFSTTP